MRSSLVKISASDKHQQKPTGSQLSLLSFALVCSCLRIELVQRIGHHFAYIRQPDDIGDRDEVKL